MRSSGIPRRSSREDCIVRTRILCRRSAAPIQRLNALQMPQSRSKSRMYSPVSYSMGVSCHPIVLGVSVGDRDTRPKDTTRNNLDTREFVVNLVTESIAEKMNIASGDYAPDVSEFDEAGLARAPSEVVRPARIANSPVNFECRLVRAVRVADNTVFFGEAVRLHVDDRVLTNGIVDARKLHAIGRLGGPQYCRTQDVFEMVRPRVTGPKSARPTDAR